MSLGKPPSIRALVKDIHDAIAELAGVQRYPDLADAIETLAQAAEGSAAPSAAEPVAPYSMDADPQGIRALVADAITGAIALGAQNEAPAPSGHWLAPFWNMGREADQWRTNVWAIALALKCLPSTYADANGHVLRAAERLSAAHPAPQAPAPSAASEREALTDERIDDLLVDVLGFGALEPESRDIGREIARVIEKELLAALQSPGKPDGEVATYRRAVMGDGAVAIGDCYGEDGTPGIIYLDMPGEKRAIGASTEDIFEPNTRPDPDRILACIHFKTPESVKQTIEILQGLYPAVSSEVQRTAPVRIYLNVSDDAEHFDKAFPKDPDGDEVTWSGDKALHCCVEYVRADLAAPAEAPAAEPGEGNGGRAHEDGGM